MREFDPVRLGNAETDAWVGYYRRQWGSVLRSFLTMVRVGFGLNWPDTVRGAWWVLRANQAWAPYPDNDPDTARAYMRRFYALVKRRNGEAFEVHEAARLDVEWWRVHRAMQHDGAPFDSLVDAVAELYAHTYGVPAASVRDAAVGRADRYLANFSCRGCTRRPMGHPPGPTTCTAVRGGPPLHEKGVSPQRIAKGKARQGKEISLLATLNVQRTGGLAARPGSCCRIVGRTKNGRRHGARRARVVIDLWGTR